MTDRKLADLDEAVENRYWELMAAGFAAARVGDDGQAAARYREAREHRLQALRERFPDFPWE